MIPNKLLTIFILVSGISSVIFISRSMDTPVLDANVVKQGQGTQQVHNQALSTELEETDTTIDKANTQISLMKDEPLPESETLNLLNSPHKAERVAAIEYLGANPNQASEKILTQQLNTDLDASVRNAAARSLGIIDAPAESTIEALLSALEDESEEVRLTALSTLENYILQAEASSETSATESTVSSQKATALKFQLETKALSPNVSETIKKAIHESASLI